MEKGPAAPEAPGPSRMSRQEVSKMRKSRTPSSLPPAMVRSYELAVEHLRFYDELSTRPPGIPGAEQAARASLTAVRASVASFLSFVFPDASADHLAVAAVEVVARVFDSGRTIRDVVVDLPRAGFHRAESYRTGHDPVTFAEGGMFIGRCVCSWQAESYRETKADADADGRAHAEWPRLQPVYRLGEII